MNKKWRFFGGKRHLNCWNCNNLRIHHHVRFIKGIAGWIRFEFKTQIANSVGTRWDVGVALIRSGCVKGGRATSQTWMPEKPIELYSSQFGPRSGQNLSQDNILLFKPLFTFPILFICCKLYRFFFLRGEKFRSATSF